MPHPNTLGLNLIEALSKFNPIIFEGILILELLPGTALVRAMDNRQVGEEVVFQSKLS
jgi:hypothetical protein